MICFKSTLACIITYQTKLTKFKLLIIHETYRCWGTPLKNKRPSILVLLSNISPPPKKYGYNNNLLFIADTNNITDNSTFFLIYFFLRI